MHAAIVADEIWGFMLEPARIVYSLEYEYMMNTCVSTRRDSKQYSTAYSLV